MAHNLIFFLVCFLFPLFISLFNFFWLFRFNNFLSLKRLGLRHFTGIFQYYYMKYINLDVTMLYVFCVCVCVFFFIISFLRMCGLKYKNKIKTSSPMISLALHTSLLLSRPFYYETIIYCIKYNNLGTRPKWKWGKTG